MSITLVSSAVFLSFWGFLVQPDANVGLYFLFIWLVLFCATSLGFLCSICVQIEFSGMIGILVVLVLTLFSTTLSGVNPVTSVVSYFSFISWASIAFYTTTVAKFEANLTPWMQNVYGFSPSLEGDENLVQLFAIVNF